MENQGELRVGLAANRQLRWAATDLTGVIEEGRRRLDLSPLATVALGRCASAAALLLRLSKRSPRRLTVEARGDGPLKRVFAEVATSGDLRGLVSEPLVEEGHRPGRRLALGTALGRGLLRVTREHAELPTYESQVELVTGEIGADVAHYLSQSEQRRAAVLLGVLAKPSGVAAAGGLIVEALPAAGTEVVSHLERKVAGVGSVSRLLGARGLIAMVEAILGELEPELSGIERLSYRCHCDRRKLLPHLAGLSAEKMEELFDGETSLSAECAFCGAVYRYFAHELIADDSPPS